MGKSFAQKLCIVFCFCCFIAADVSAQQYSKYVVVFKNKNNSPYKLDNPLEYLSRKSVQRRIRYDISIDSSDLPVNPNYINQVLAQGSVTYLSQSKWLNQVLINTTSTQALNAIKALSFVKSVNIVGPGSTTLKTDNLKFKEKTEPFAESSNIKQGEVTTADHYDYGSSFGQIHIHNGELLHNHGFTGKGVTIAIIDAGFYRYKTTAAFDSARAHGQILGERDFVDFDGSVNEDNDHGELCLSAIAANVPGVMVGTAPDAKFWLLRSENVNSEFPVEEHNWAVAAEFADSVGVDLISSSLGYMQFDDPQFNHTYDDIYANTTMVSRAASYAAKKGILVTNSAGNEGSGSWKYIIFPSDADSVCAVAATNVNGNIAYFSSYGYPGKVKPNIASVGSGTILYAYYGLTSGSGTSFSNPNINGLIACLWQAFPEFNNITILSAVYASADRYKNPDNRYGYGIPDMRKAYIILKKLQNQKLYGDKWLIAGGTSFNDEINFKVVGQVDDVVTISLIDARGKLIARNIFSTEQYEVYNRSFPGLNSLPAGNYTLKYDDGMHTKTVELVK